MRKRLRYLEKQLNIVKERSKNNSVIQGIETNNNITNTTNTNLEVDNINSIFSPTNFHSFMISTLTLSILLFILKPSLLLNSTQLLSLSLFNC